MASAKGYHSYRGRGSKAKVFLALLLCLVILAAVGFIYIQEHSVYDENGIRHLEIPWLPEEEPEAPAVDPAPEEPLDLVIQEPAGPEPLRLASLPAEAMTQALWSAQSGATGLSSVIAYDGVAVTLKDGEGHIFFDFTGALSNTTVKQDTGETLAAITARDDHTVARLACLSDAPVARVHVTDMGLKNTGGYIFYDGNNNLWLDPAKPSTREYVCALAKEIAELGFDELLLTDLSYPTEGKINKIYYNTDVPLANNLDLLLGELRTALEPYDILLSVEVPESVIAEGPDTVAGLDLNRLAARVDRIYAATALERVETLANLVAQAAGENGKTEFVPELAAGGPAPAGSRLILAE